MGRKIEPGCLVLVINSMNNPDNIGKCLEVVQRMPSLDYLFSTPVWELDSGEWESYAPEEWLIRIDDPDASKTKQKEEELA